MATHHHASHELLRLQEKIRSIVSRFGYDVLPLMAGDGRAEDKLRVPVHHLVTNIGDLFGRSVTVHHEVAIRELASRPDLAINSASGNFGFIELKRNGKGIPEHASWRPDKHDREQWAKLRNLPNLIYTDGTYWALYRRGALIGHPAELEGNLATAGANLKPKDDHLERLFKTFFAWILPEPSTLNAVVSEVAPLCRLLRSQVEEAMIHEAGTPGKRPLTTLAGEWRNILFPNLKDPEFADAYAQAVTFAMLLARVDGIGFDHFSLSNIADQLGKQHPLLGEALSILTHQRWVKYLSVIDLLKAIIGNINWSTIDLGESGVYTLLYEKFLAEYDPKLRRESGTYYTPDAIARAMVRFTDEVLKTALDKPRGLAADDVIVVDPAMGTGTFLVEVIENVAATLRAERGSKTTPQAHLRELFARRLVGFEVQAAPFAVAELRLHHLLKTKYGIELPNEEVRYFCNALDDPDTIPLDFGQLYDILKASREGANIIKRDKPVMVVLGNPPWREQASGDAPWLEARRDPKLVPPDLSIRPSLDEFRDPAQWRRAFNLKNMWTYFWRWGTWKVFDAHPRDPAGIVTLITPKAYIWSASHSGMRKYLRETADVGWIIDLSPEGFEPPVPTRIFPKVRQPICIGIFARQGTAQHKTPARVFYTAISGTRDDKFSRLAELSPVGAEWQECDDGWSRPFQPRDVAWESFPGLDDLFPRQTNGVNANRNWIWAPDRQTLRRRWATLVSAFRADKRSLFKETNYRDIEKCVPAVAGVPSGDVSIAQETNDAPNIARAALHSFDRQFIVLDRRVIDRPREELWYSYSANQVYISEPPGYLLPAGPSLSFSAYVPYVHHFMGHDAGRIIPLYLDPAGRRPNVAPRLLDALGDMLGIGVDETDLLAYVAAVTAHPAYTSRFRLRLTAPGVRVPLTRNYELWKEAVEIGSELLWLHSYGERYVDPLAGRIKGAGAVRVKYGQARYASPIPASEAAMPIAARYDAATSTIKAENGASGSDAGCIERVEPAVWNYQVGDRKVVAKWLSYRMQNTRRKKRTSDLDSINPTSWTAQFDDELLELLAVLRGCVELEVRQATLLERVCADPLVREEDLRQSGVLLGSSAGGRAIGPLGEEDLADSA